jgi:hypothetical protein
MEAYSAVHNKEAKEEFYSHKDEISEMDFSLINQTELDDIAEEVLEELFEEGYSVEQCEAIFEEVLTEARVTYGSDTESPRAKKMSAVKSSLEGAMGKVKEKAAKGAVKSYGAYRSAKQSATDKANRLKQSASNASAVTMRKAKDAKAGIKSGIKGMIRKAAKKVGDAANKVSNRMSEGTVRRDIRDIYQAIYEKRANKDYDGDGEVESGKDEYFGSRDKAIKKAMGKKGKCEKCGKDPCECEGMNEEYLDELSKGTMGSYVKKASKDVEKRSYTQGSTDAEDAEIGYPGQTPKDKKIDKRQKGIGKAVDKMTRKEELESLRQAYLSISNGGEHLDEISLSEGEQPNIEYLNRYGGHPEVKPKKKKKTPFEKENPGHSDSKPTARFTKADREEMLRAKKEASDKVAADANKARKTQKEEVTFSEAELKAIQAKVDAWDVEEGYQRNPEKGEAEARKSETSGQKAERNVRGRLKTMDPDKAEAMKKQMRAVGLNV